MGSYSFKGQAWRWGCTRREAHRTLPLGETEKDGERNPALGRSSVLSPMEDRLEEADLKAATTPECHHQESFHSWLWGNSRGRREERTHVS